MYAKARLQGIFLGASPFEKGGAEGDLSGLRLARPCKSPLTPLFQRGEPPTNKAPLSSAAEAVLRES
ncbi:MAG: hypothetical protein B7X12_08140 [Halothiobacillus sp. 20-53-49]|nr:MAG: hypothetical protein B7X12_08140 [Halothiobacillus sp. 20-53-49]